MSPHLSPSRPGTPPAHPGARILRTRSEPTDFLNQKVGKYVEVSGTGMLWPFLIILIKKGVIFRNNQEKIINLVENWSVGP